MDYSTQDKVSVGLFNCEMSLISVLKINTEETEALYVSKRSGC